MSLETRMSRRSTIRDATALLLSTAALGVTVVLLRMLPDVSETTVALALLLVVLGTATMARLGLAIIVSVVAMLAFNFFFLPPVGTLTIADPQNWIALFAFLTVAVIASNLSAAAKGREREAIARGDEVTRLFDLTRDVLLTTDTATAMETLARRWHAVSNSQGGDRPAGRRWLVDLPRRDERRAIDWTSGSGPRDCPWDAGVRRAPARVWRPRAHRRRPDWLTIVPLRHGVKAMGLLAAVAPDLDLGTLDALGGVVAIAMSERSSSASATPPSWFGKRRTSQRHCWRR